MMDIDDIGRAAAAQLRDAVLAEVDASAALARLDSPLAGVAAGRRRPARTRVVALVAAALVIAAGVIIVVRHDNGRDRIINPVVTTTTSTPSSTTTTEPSTTTATTTVASTSVSAVATSTATVTPTGVPDTALPRLVFPNPALTPYQLKVGPCAACATTQAAAAVPSNPPAWMEIFLLPGRPLADGAIGVLTETSLGVFERPGKVLIEGGHVSVAVQRAGLLAVVSGWNVAQAEVQRIADGLNGSGSDAAVSVGYVPAGFASAGAPARWSASTATDSWSVSYGAQPGVTVGAFRADSLETARALVTPLNDGFRGGMTKKPYTVRGHDAVALVSASGPATISTIEWQETKGAETYVDRTGTPESIMLGYASSLHPATANEWAALRATSTCTGPLHVTLERATDNASAATATFVVHNDGPDACPGGTLGHPTIEFHDEHDQVVKITPLNIFGDPAAAAFGAIPAHDDVSVQVNWSTSPNNRLEPCPPVTSVVITFSYAPPVRLPFDPSITGVAKGPCTLSR